MENAIDGFPPGLNPQRLYEDLTGDYDFQPAQNKNYFSSIGFSHDPDMGKRIRVSVLSFHKKVSS